VHRRNTLTLHGQQPTSHKTRSRGLSPEMNIAAMLRSLILVTDDEMRVIRECVTELRFDNWIA